MQSFREFGVLPAFRGVLVSDRYASYFHEGWEHISGNQACLARDGVDGSGSDLCQAALSVVGVVVSAG